ncbi:molybdopterin-binding protein [Kitasatospora sp. NPDC052896]|uniref:molybdopterin-binding protein n=1 Tax=Kitasatospora sp. NPDC052896 TaxID=3364061 RepID=UPI0037CC0C38
MTLSMRNQLSGTVLSVTEGAVMATVRVRTASGRELTSAVTTDAVAELELTVGAPVTLLVKSTEVSLATGSVDGLSIRNRIPGTVSRVTTGGAMATVKVTVEDGELTAAVTREAVEELDLAAGSPVTALVKSTELSLASA